MWRSHLAGLAIAFSLLAWRPAGAAESWNSACLTPLRQAKEDWTRLATAKARDAVAREIRLAEQSYRRGRDQDCKDRVERIKAMMK